MTSIAIVGCGAAGSALAADLTRRGFEPPRVFDRDDDVMAALVATGGVVSRGMIGDRIAPVRALPLADCVDGAVLVVVAVTADRHEEVAQALAPLLRPGQRVLLYCGYVAGCLWFRRAFLAAGGSAGVVIVEAANTLHLCGLVRPGEVFVSAVKAWLEITGLDPEGAQAVLDVVGPAFPEFTAGANCLETGLINPNPVGHLPAAVYNFALFEEPAARLNAGTLHFDELHWPGVRAAASAFDRERCGLIAALGLTPMSRPDFNARSYPPGSRMVGEPPRFGGKLLLRHVHEDGPCALVPMLSLAEAIGFAMPAARALATALRLVGVDLDTHGRSVARIGPSALRAVLPAGLRLETP